MSFISALCSLWHSPSSTPLYQTGITADREIETKNNKEISRERKKGLSCYDEISVLQPSLQGLTHVQVILGGAQI